MNLRPQLHLKLVGKSLLMVGAIAVAVFVVFLIVKLTQGSARANIPSRTEALKLYRMTTDLQTWFDGAHLVAKTKVMTDRGDLLHPQWAFPAAVKYYWDFGNGLNAETENEGFTVYNAGGNFEIQVYAVDGWGRIVGYGTQPVESPYKLFRGWTNPEDPINTLESPVPEGTPAVANRPLQRPIFLNVPELQARLAIEGEPVSFVGADELKSAFVREAGVGNLSIWRATKQGFFHVTTNKLRDYYIFVSPTPSYHIDRPDFNWYLTQWNTETTSNCGPTVTAMSIEWSKGKEVKVIDIRTKLGWQGDGAVSLNEMQSVLTEYGVQTNHIALNSTEDIFKALDQNHLIAVSYNMAGVTEVDSPGTNLLGQYYTDHGGHYLALKGYSTDRKYFIVYDPIPSDWAFNAKRYGDGLSMYGRNRYYPVGELWNALYTRTALEIAR